MPERGAREEAGQTQADTTLTTPTDTPARGEPEAQGELLVNTGEEEPASLTSVRTGEAVRQEMTVE